MFYVQDFLQISDHVFLHILGDDFSTQITESRGQELEAAFARCLIAGQYLTEHSSQRLLRIDLNNKSLSLYINPKQPKSQTNLCQGDQRHMDLLQLTGIFDDQQLRQDVGDFRGVFLGIFAQLRQILDGLSTNLDVGIFAEVQLGINGDVGQMRKELEKLADKLGGETLLFGLSLDRIEDFLVLLFVLCNLHDGQLIMG